MLLGKIKKIDIRKMGSGNAGGTNAFRTQGIFFALPVVLIDIGIGYIAAHFFSSITLFGPNVFDFSHLVYGSAAVIGHCYPVFHNFKGGKGAGTALGGETILIEPSTPRKLILSWPICIVSLSIPAPLTNIYPNDWNITFAFLLVSATLIERFVDIKLRI